MLEVLVHSFLLNYNIQHLELHHSIAKNSYKNVKKC